MKIFEIQLQNAAGEIVYKSLVPEVHVQEKIDTLVAMNEISEISGIFIKDVGDISDRYIQRFVNEGSKQKEPAKKTS